MWYFWVIYMWSTIVKLSTWASSIYDKVYRSIYIHIQYFTFDFWGKILNVLGTMRREQTEKCQSENGSGRRKVRKVWKAGSVANDTTYHVCTTKYEWNSIESLNGYIYTIEAWMKYEWGLNVMWYEWNITEILLKLRWKATSGAFPSSCWSFFLKLFLSSDESRSWKRRRKTSQISGQMCRYIGVHSIAGWLWNIFKIFSGT